MMFSFFQIDQVGRVFEKGLDVANNQGGGSTIAIMVLIILAGLGAMWIYFIQRPNNIAAIASKQASDRQSEVLSEAVKGILIVTDDNRKTSATTKELVEDLKIQVERMRDCLHPTIEALQIMAKQNGVDIAQQLGEMQGALGSNRH